MLIILWHTVVRVNILSTECWRESLLISIGDRSDIWRLEWKWHPGIWQQKGKHRSYNQYIWSGVIETKAIPSLLNIQHRKKNNEQRSMLKKNDLTEKRKERKYQRDLTKKPYDEWTQHSVSIRCLIVVFVFRHHPNIKKYTGTPGEDPFML